MSDLGSALDSLDLEDREELAPTNAVGKLVWSQSQLDIFDFVKNGEGNAVVEATAGSGKCLGRNTPVLLYNGVTIPVQDVRPTDWLIGPDSKPRKVISVSSGRGKLYKITPVKGDSFICNEDHVLTLTGTNNLMGQTIDISLKDILENDLDNFRPNKKGRIDRQWKLLRSGVNTEISNYYTDMKIIDPYLMGVWIGDGTTMATAITSQDVEIIEYVTKSVKKYGLEAVVRDENEKGLKYIYIRVGTRGKTGPHTPHIMRRELIHFRNEYKEKSIPIYYLWNTRENRLSLLAGILDSDGHYSEGYYEVSSKLQHLAQQYAFLARSLGFAAYVHKKNFLFRDKPQTSWRVTISGDLVEIPCKVERKKALPRKQIKRVNVTGWSVEYIGMGDYYGFTIDGDGRFLLGDFTVTHNTTTLVESLRYTNPDIRVGFVAFNRRIADELRERSPDHVHVSTLHSLGLRNIKRTFPKTQVVKNKMWKLLNQYSTTLGYSERQLLKDNSGVVMRLVSLLKATLVEPGNREMRYIVDRYSLAINGQEEFIFLTANNLWGMSRDTIKDMVNFDDMIFASANEEVSCEKFDFLFIDEAQDLNNAQTQFTLKSVAEGGRVVAVGDRFQAIYGWSGSDTDSISNLIHALNATTFPLTVTYRCPTKVVALAQQIVPHIRAREGAPEGIVETIRLIDMHRLVKEGDLVICRVNAPLVPPAFSLIRNGVKAVILGREIGRGLTTLINKIGKRTTSNDLSDLLAHMSTYVQREATKLMAAKKHSRAISLQDQFATIVALADGCDSVAEIKSKIEQVFDDNRKGVTFSSIHKIKGGEAERVFILEPKLIPHPLATAAWEINQEFNLSFVAITRAKEELYFVE